MRKSRSLRATPLYGTGALAFAVLTATPVQAQRRDDAARLEATRGAASLTEGSARPAFSLNQLFSPAHFRMSHTVEFSSSSWAGGGASMGAYTNTMQWRFDKVDARVDVSMLQPFGGGFGASSLGLNGAQNRPQVFLRNAEVAYRPFESTELRFSVQQSPYGAYASPYGYRPLGSPAPYDVRTR